MLWIHTVFSVLLYINKSVESLEWLHTSAGQRSLVKVSLFASIATLSFFFLAQFPGPVNKGIMMHHLDFLKVDKNECKENQKGLGQKSRKWGKWVRYFMHKMLLHSATLVCQLRFCLLSNRKGIKYTFIYLSSICFSCSSRFLVSSLKNHEYIGSI